MDKIDLGCRVEVTNKGLGTVRFKGDTKFAPGIVWIGVELDEAKGKNNGQVQDTQYFECAENHGCFVKEDAIRLIETEDEPPPAARASPTGSIGSAGSSSSASRLKKPGPTATTTTTTTSPPRKSSTMALREKKQALAQRIRQTGATTTPSSNSRPSTPQSALRTDTATTRKLEKELEEREGKIKLLKSQVEEKTNEVAEVKEALSAKSSVVSNLESEIRSLNSQNEKLQRELEVQSQASKAKLDRLEEAKAKELEELNGMIETLTLDKEQIDLDRDIAEEKVTDLELQIEQLKLEKEELQLESEAAAAAPSSTGGGDDDDDDGNKLATVLAENGKLREALKRLHSASATEKTDLTRQVKTLTKERDQLSQTAAEVETLRRGKSGLDEQIEELKSMLDTAQAYESMVEELSERNLELQDEVAEVKQANEELEELQQLSEEMEQQQRDSLKDLEQELQSKQTQINNYEIQIEQLNKHEGTFTDGVEKLRTRILSLQENEAILKQRIMELEDIEKTLTATNRSIRQEKHDLSQQSANQMKTKLQYGKALYRHDISKIKLGALRILVPDKIVAAGEVGKVLEMLETSLTILFSSRLVVNMFCAYSISLLDEASSQNQGDGSAGKPEQNNVLSQMAKVCLTTASTMDSLWALLRENEEGKTIEFDVLKEFSSSVLPVFMKTTDVIDNLLNIIENENLFSSVGERQCTSIAVIEGLVSNLDSSNQTYTTVRDRVLLEYGGDGAGDVLYTLRAMQLVFLEEGEEETRRETSRRLEKYCLALEAAQAKLGRYIELPSAVKVGEIEEMEICLDPLRQYFKNDLEGEVEAEGEGLLFTCTGWNKYAAGISETLASTDAALTDYENVKSLLNKRIVEVHQMTNELSNQQLVREDLEKKLDASREQLKASQDFKNQVRDMEEKLTSKTVEYDQAVNLAKAQCEEYEAELETLRAQVASATSTPVRLGTPMSALKAKPNDDAAMSIVGTPTVVTSIDGGGTCSSLTVRMLQEDAAYWKARSLEHTVHKGLKPLVFKPKKRYNGRVVPLFQKGEDRVDLRTGTALLQKALLLQSNIRVCNVEKAPEVSLNQQLLKNRISALQLINLIDNEHTRKPPKAFEKAGRIKLIPPVEEGDASESTRILLSRLSVANLHKQFPVLV